MRLKEDVESNILVLNTLAQGPFVFDQQTGEIIAKNNIEHFVIVHAIHPEEINAQMTTTKKKPRKKKAAKVSEEEEIKKVEEAMAEQSAFEDIDEDEELGRDEETATLKPEAELRLIARIRKINQPSITVLNDDGWFLCPVYKGMTALRPMILERLPRKKGYRSIISSVVLMDFTELGIELPFREDNLFEWEVNSMFILNKLFEKNNPYGLLAESIFVHKRIDMRKHDLKSSISRLETTQKTRIKLGNILIDEVLVHVGQERYTDNKEKLAILGGKKSKSKEELTELDLDDVKIIEHIVAAYNRINEKAAEMGYKWPIIREATFNNVMEAINKDDQQSHEKDAKDLILKKTMEAEEDDTVTVPSYDEAYEMTNTLRTKDYITSFVTYMNTKVYMNAKSNENDANTVVKRLAKDDPLWPFAEGIHGFGEISFAYLQANIDWRAATHPSSVIRYLGMDNVVYNPKREDNEKLTDSDAIRYIELIVTDVKRTIDKFKDSAFTIKDIDSETYSIYFSTDIIKSYQEFLIAKEFADKEIFGLHLAEVDDKLQNVDMNKMANDYPDFASLIVRTWHRLEVVYITNQDGVKVPAVKKRARKKSDTVLSTYITKEGKVKCKKSRGYNAKVKSRFIENAFQAMNKTYKKDDPNSNPYIAEYYRHKERLRQRAIASGDVPNNLNLITHLQARRFVMQIFLENFWMYARRFYNLPLNGGTYYEAKLHGSHGHGFDPALSI